MQSIFMALIGCLIKLKAALSGQWPLTFPDKPACRISPGRGPGSAALARRSAGNNGAAPAAAAKPPATGYLSKINGSARGKCCNCVGKGDPVLRLSATQSPKRERERVSDGAKDGSMS